MSSLPALTIGYGSIGSEIARELRSLMNVTVTDKDEIALAGAAKNLLKNISEQI